jgi:hypothetical protein
MRVERAAHNRVNERELLRALQDPNEPQRVRSHGCVQVVQLSEASRVAELGAVAQDRRRT